MRRNTKKKLGLGTFDRFNDLNGEDYQGLEAAESNEKKFWNDYESVTSKMMNNNNFIKSS